MIRVQKSENIPASLQKENCTSYSGEDVKKQLYADHEGKCYLCETKVYQNFEIEHLRPKADNCFPELIFEWTNLFLVCPHCNGKKSNTFTQIKPPFTYNVEDSITQRINFNSQKAEFSTSCSEAGMLETIDLLQIIHNGNRQLRNIKTQIVYEKLQSEILLFLKLICSYKQGDVSSKSIIIDSLKLEKEFLAFKYWILKDYNFIEEFEPFICWNKES